MVADKVTTSRRSWVNTMVEKELGLSAEPEGSALKDSLSMGASYLLASLVPLGPYLFLPVRPAFVVSVALTIVALFVIGLVKGRLATMSLWRSAARGRRDRRGLGRAAAICWARSSRTSSAGKPPPFVLR